MTPEKDFGLVLPAAGLGSRFGSSLPKQFYELDGKPLYLHALEPFLDLVVEAVVVVPAEWENRISAQIRSLSVRTPIRVQTGASSRQDSVLNGLSGLASNTKYVLVHDAARPYVSPGLIRSVMQSTREHGASIPVVPVCDTVKIVEASLVVRTLDRHSLRLTQTPQGFELELLKKAFERAKVEAFQGTDESSLVENLGVMVHVVAGEANNIKVTWLDDLGRSQGSLG